VVATALILATVTLERLFELWLANRNTRHLLERGAYERGSGHYPWLTSILALWLAGLWLLAWGRALEVHWLTAFAVSMALKLWVIATLGRRWTARIIILPNAPLVRSGAYRIVPHPNYLFLMCEIITLPLTFSLVWFAAASAVAVGLLILVRIRSESTALAEITSGALR